MSPKGLDITSPHPPGPVHPKRQSSRHAAHRLFYFQAACLSSPGRIIEREHLVSHGGDPAEFRAEGLIGDLVADRVQMQYGKLSRRFRADQLPDEGNRTVIGVAADCRCHADGVLVDDSMDSRGLLRAG